MRNTRLYDKIKIVNAVVPTVGSVAAVTATVVAGAGFDRCMFVITTGAAATGATLNLKVQSSDATGGTYADVTSAALAEVTAAAGASKQFVIDMPVDSAKPFMKLVGAVDTDTFANSAIAVLYRGSAYPVATSYATQAIVL